MIDFRRLSRERHKILLVDDDRDVHLLSRMVLKSMSYAGRGVEILTAKSGEEALHILASCPNIAVVLLDVVMETDRSGLETCDRIRNDLANSFVRILLRTGQPGAAPERDVIQRYDIDGYLAKGDLTAARLFSSVRTSLKAFTELTRLEHHRAAFQKIDDTMLSMRSYESVESMLERIVKTGIDVLDASELAVHLALSTDAEREYSLLHAVGHDAVETDMRCTLLHRRITSWIREHDVLFHSEGVREPEIFENGLLVRFVLDHGLGEGWIFAVVEDRDKLARHCLSLISRHAANCFYGAAAQRQIDWSMQRPAAVALNL